MDVAKQEHTEQKQSLSFLSKNIRVLRKQMKMSQEELASNLGLNRGNIASYENGSAEPKICNLLKIAHFFQVSLIDLTQYNLQDGRTQAITSSRLHGLAPEERAKIEELYERASEFGDFLNGLHTCYQYKKKKLHNGNGLPREAEVLAGYFEQLYEATIQLAEEHSALLQMCKCNKGANKA